MNVLLRKMQDLGSTQAEDTAFNRGPPRQH